MIALLIFRSVISWSMTRLWRCIVKLRSLASLTNQWTLYSLWYARTHRIGSTMRESFNRRSSSKIWRRCMYLLQLLSLFRSRASDQEHSRGSLLLSSITQMLRRLFLDRSSSQVDSWIWQDAVLRNRIHPTWGQTCSKKVFLAPRYKARISSIFQSTVD